VRTLELQQPRLQFRALVAPDSFNPDDLSFEVVWATERAVFRVDEFEGSFDEVLGLTPEEVRLDRLNAGAPLLDSHRQFGLENQIGVVVEGSARVDGTRGTARVRLLDHPSNERTIAGVRDGVFSNVSVGFQVYRFRDVTERGDERRVLRAVDWEPHELTLLPVPADFDAGARSRSGDVPTCLVELEAHPTKANMDPEETTTTPDTGDTPTETRGAGPAPAPAVEPTGETTPAPTSSAHRDDVDLDAVRAEAATTERDRVATITRTAASLGIGAGDQLVRGLIEEGTPLDGDQGARARLLQRAALADEELETRGANRVTVGRDEGEKTVAGIEGALLARCSYRELDPETGFHTKPVQLDDAARSFSALRVLDLAKHVMRAHGQHRVDRMPDHEVAKLALRGLGASTSDFPNLLANVGAKRLQMGFANEPRTFLPLVSFTRVAQDFKTMSSPAFGGGPSLAEIEELGAYTMTALGERGETYQVKKYGRIWGYSWEAMLNDDLSAFDRVPAQMGANASRVESDAVWTDLIIGNVVMGDGVALFNNANHANDEAGSTPIAIAGLGTLREKMRIQTGIDGERLNLFPSNLVVGPRDETLAQQFTSMITPDSGGNVNPFQSAFQNVIVENRLQAFDGWYMASAATQTETLEVARLAGMDGPSIETRNGWDVDGVEVKVRHVFGAMIPEYRGWQRAAN